MEIRTVNHSASAEILSLLHKIEILKHVQTFMTSFCFPNKGLYINNFATLNFMTFIYIWIFIFQLQML